MTDLISLAPGVLLDVLSLGNLLAVGAGVLIGLLTGLLPGLSGVNGITILLPFLFVMEPSQGIAVMMGIVAANVVSDAAPAILFGIPGSAAAQATILDGPPMARRGEASRALGASYSAALFGGLVGAAILIAAIPVAQTLVTAVASPELFVLGLLGIAALGALSGGNIAKGMAAGGLGLLLGMMGVDAVRAWPRWTFDTIYLYDGISLEILALGLFGIPEVLELMHGSGSISDGTDTESRSGILDGIRDTIRNWFLVVRTALLGVFVGLIPGLGSAVVDWFAYAHARETVPGGKETFGTGDVRGIIGVDAAASAKDSGALLPTLFFGVPGSTVTALLLALFVVHDITPGPDMATVNLDVTLFVAWSLALANVLATLVMLGLGRGIAKIATLPVQVLSPFLVALIAFASVQASRRPADLLVLALIGLLGTLMKEAGWPRPPLLIGFILSPILERYYFISVQIYGASWLLRPGVLVGLALAAVLVWFARRTEGKDGPPTPIASREEEPGVHAQSDV